MIYEYIIIGAGASGLFAAATLNINKNSAGLILEQTGRAGTKLLMSGNGQCNITHAGDIKSFVSAYGDNGKKIRSMLYKHNNSELIDFLESHGVKTVTREDGKIFPASFQAKDILDLLLDLSAKNGFKLKLNSPVTKIVSSTKFDAHVPGALAVDTGTVDAHVPGALAVDTGTVDAHVPGALAVDTGTVDAHVPGALAVDTRAVDKRAAGTCASCSEIKPSAVKEAARPVIWTVYTANQQYQCYNLIIATGGCSYHRTGSDGSMFTILNHNFGVNIKTPKPALCPLKVKNYPFAELAGITFEDATCTIIHSEKCTVSEGKTDKTEKAEKTTETDNSASASTPEIIIKEKAIARETGGLLLTHKDFSGPAVINISKYAEIGDKIKINYCKGDNYEQVLAFLKKGGKLSDYVPKRFEDYLRSRYGNSPKELAKALTGEEFIITSSGDFNKAMATSGGIELSQINLKTMEFRNHPGLYAIGEALDIDGKTGGYNLQFAWSSARCITADTV